MFILNYLNSSKLKRNATANFLRVVLTVPLSFFFIYFILKKITLADYGVWALAFSFFSFFNFFDLGISGTITRYIAFYQTKKNYAKITKIFISSLFFYFLTGLVILFLLIFFRSFFIINFFKNSDLTLTAQGSVFTLMVILGFFNFIFSTFISLLNGIQKMVITNFTELLKSFIFTVLGTILLIFNPNINSLVISFSMAVFIASFINFYFCLKYFKKLSFGLSFFDYKLLKEMLGFGLQTQFSSLAAFVHANFDKFLISFFFGVDKAGMLDIALKIINQARTLASSLISPLLPAAAEKTIIFKNKIHDFYQRTFKYVAIWCSLIFLGLVAFSPLVIKLWLGPEFAQVAIFIQILAVGNFVNLLTGPGSSILLAQNNPRPVMIAAIADTVINVLFSYLGIISFGLYGAVAGTTLAMTLVNGVVIYIFPKLFKKYD